MSELMRARMQATLIHILFSAVLLGLALFLVFFLWYPAPLPGASGVTDLYTMMLVIDLTLGPTLTFLVFKRDRLKFIFDIVVIVSAQLLFYLYGLYTVSQGRPEWLVFVVDDFELIRPVDIDNRYEADFPPEFRATLWDGPRWVAAVYSDDEEIAQAQKEDEMFLGISLAARPEAYVQLVSRKEALAEKSRPFDDLASYNEASEVDEVLAGHPDAVGWLPMKGVEKDMVVLIDGKGSVLGVVPLMPWE